MKSDCNYHALKNPLPDPARRDMHLISLKSILTLSSTYAYQAAFFFRIFQMSRLISSTLAYRISLVVILKVFGNK
jgi:hypothetical protein